MGICLKNERGINNYELKSRVMDSGGKKTGLDSLSQEELIGKCKNFLQLAQKAKKAKDGRLLV